MTDNYTQTQWKRFNAAPRPRSFTLPAAAAVAGKSATAAKLPFLFNREQRAAERTDALDSLAVEVERLRVAHQDAPQTPVPAPTSA